MNPDVWIAAAAGGIIGWLLGTFKMRARTAVLETALTLSERRSTDDAAMHDRFRALADDILERKSRAVAEESGQRIGSMLTPLQERLKAFHEQIELLRITENNERAALRAEVTHLAGLNKLLNHETQRLGEALRGSAKLRGDWGETVLTRLFEAAGLTEGREYRLQPSGRRAEDDKLLRPDAVLLLPGGRNIVIDAKVSLNGLLDFADAGDDATRKAALKRLSGSLRAHVQGLAAKNYPALLPEGETLDFTVMFVPSEAAFTAALTADDDLLHDAWAKNILPAGPSTLMFAVRTAAYMWRVQNRTQNAQRIAERGAALYDKLSDFLADMEKVGERLDRARDSFASARDKLVGKRGNVLRQAQQLVELGVKPSKKITAFADVAEEEEEPA